MVCEGKDEASTISPARGLGAQLIAREAQKAAGAEISWVNYRVAVAETSDRMILIDGTTVNESIMAARIADNKVLTKSFLTQAGVSTPQGTVVGSEEQAIAFAQKLEGPVVVKPAKGSMGKGVSVNVFSAREVREAYRLAASINPVVLVEQFIDIDFEARCIATSQEFVSSYKRVLPSVVGNGEASIRELILEANLLKEESPLLRNHPIPVDATLLSTLDAQGWRIDDVLESGKRLVVRNVGGLSSGGEPHEITSEFSDELRQMAVRSIRSIPGLHWGGIDLAVERHTGRAYVIEVNVNAGFAGSMFPVSGDPVNVAAIAWRERFKRSHPLPPAEGRFPERHTEPSTMDTLYPHLWTKSQVVRLSGLLWNSLEGSGLFQARRLASLVQLKGHDGRERWFSSDLRGENDSLSAYRLSRRHASIRKILRERGVRQVRAAVVSSADQVARFSPRHRGLFAATPVNSPWLGADCHIGHRACIEKLMTGSSRWVIQPYWDGVRLRAYASKDRVFALTSSSGGSRFTQEMLIGASKAAISVMRAVPDLRWAAVDLYVPGATPTDGESREPVFEGIQVDPKLASAERLLAGSFSVMADWVVR
ncbi:ATP-grasp domain-containing protein [Nesterenkonia salmonea]|uniref:ATP-grasp domain-containing protein n=1 Tax=Nesterenkonia salmonea TaxID=1804987 RepID=A0A5R9BEQ4_9MICC|nr:ATP-grasp domain-containing protein [Nesterenkonia salmonea]TLP99048.1 ATP-grasp domain-containing protein [Nesterenkonia salmonea]